MLKLLVAVLTLAFVCPSAAEARHVRHHHHHARHHHVHHHHHARHHHTRSYKQRVAPCVVFCQTLNWTPRERAAHAVGIIPTSHQHSWNARTPSRFIRGRLICARNVGAALAARGIRGTGSALAKSYLHWGRASGPVPGAVAVFGRRGGGHVAIVDHVEPNGTVIYLNPSSRRQAWQVGPYRRKPLAFRVATN
jgi:hypothetical protein